MAENKVYKWLEQAPKHLGIVCRNEADVERCIEILNPFFRDELDQPDLRRYAQQGYGYIRIDIRLPNGLYDFGFGDSEAIMRECGAVPIEFEDFLREISEEPIALSNYIM